MAQKKVKGIDDLNPVKKVSDTDLVENTEDNETQPTEEAADTEQPSEKRVVIGSGHEDERKYVDKGVDTTFGSSFDFGDSLDRRMETLNTNVKKIKQEQEDEDLEKEISESSDDSIESGNSEFNFNLNDNNSEDDSLEDDEAEVTVPAKKVAPAKKQDEKPASAEAAVFSTKTEMPSQSELFIDDEDIDDIDESDMEEIGDKQLEQLKEQVKAKLNVGLDLTGYTISKEAISINSILGEEVSEETFDWPLMSAGKVVSMKKFSGVEIEALNGGNSKSRFHNLRAIYHQFYNHIVEANKPDFETWLKVTSFMDIPHLYMAAYNASFNDSNYIPMTCIADKCNNIFLTDNINIAEKMTKFKDDKAKGKFNEIMNNLKIECNNVYETTIVPVSDKFAIGFRNPSIFNTLFENAILEQKFVDKYQKVLYLMVYIDNIYHITNDKRLVPVSLKVDPKDIVKTTKYRISVYAKALQALPSDGFQLVSNVINSINELGEDVTYQLPEVNCPKCNHIIPAEDAEASRLLFSRHQLALIANS
jgi:hypothetical protein